MRKSITFSAAAMLAMVPLVAQAQEHKVDPAETTEASKLTPEQLENYRRGVTVIRAFTAAFTSDKVDTAVKGRLISCLYNNKLSVISAAAGQALASDPALDSAKPADIYRAAAGACGITFKPVAPEDGATEEPEAQGR